MCGSPKAMLSRSWARNDRAEFPLSGESRRVEDPDAVAERPVGGAEERAVAELQAAMNGVGGGDPVGPRSSAVGGYASPCPLQAGGLAIARADDMDLPASEDLGLVRLRGKRIVRRLGEGGGPEMEQETSVGQVGHAAFPVVERRIGHQSREEPPRSIVRRANRKDRAVGAEVFFGAAEEDHELLRAGPDDGRPGHVLSGLFIDDDIAEDLLARSLGRGAYGEEDERKDAERSRVDHDRALRSVSIRRSVAASIG